MVEFKKSTIMQCPHLICQLPYLTCFMVALGPIHTGHIQANLLTEFSFWGIGNPSLPSIISVDLPHLKVCVVTYMFI